MGADPLAVGALVVCCAAWLLAATFLTLDPLGHRPFARRSDTRAYRLQTAAGLAAMTLVILTQIAALAHWPRSLQMGLDAMTLLAGLAVLASVITAASIRSTANRAQHPAGDPNGGENPTALPGSPSSPLG